MVIEISGKQYLDVAEIVKVMKSHKSTVWRWLREGTLPGHKVGKRYLVQQEDLEKFVAGR